MKSRTYLLASILVLMGLIAAQCSGATLYVSLKSTNPVAPFGSWGSAAANIQDAVEVAQAGDLIVVSNGVYEAGSQLAPDGTTNRLVVTKPVTIQSLNGSAVTDIDGGTIMRCVFLTNGAVLNGFTLIYGNAVNGGGVYCTSTNALVLNCLLTGNAARAGGGAYSGTVSNCTFRGNTCRGTGGRGGGAAEAVLISCTVNQNSTGTPYPVGSGSSIGGGVSNCKVYDTSILNNSAYGAGAGGGGAYDSVLNNCLVSGNFADYGPGAAYNSTGTNCTISNNRSGFSGGGVTGGSFYKCWISDNDSAYGGGVHYNAVLYSCVISNNYADYGAGASGGTLNNCLLVRNQADAYGGGADGSTLNNCTLVENTAQGFGAYGGGAYGGTLNNCIINTGGQGVANTYSSTLRQCCTPDPMGTGTITNAPTFMGDGNFRLQAGSPCINAGTNFYVIDSKDVEGNLRIAGLAVDMGLTNSRRPGR